ncbi:MAG: phosphate acyltransferase PlsX [Dehalococcoidia bacterium]|nr:phosphate acyltransferase PlsX [Dehalococcoidia bacterium]
MRLALDAMGGDFAPHVVVQGALNAARTGAFEVALVGQRAVLEPLLAVHRPLPPNLHVEDAPDLVAMDDHPSAAVRQKPRSSIGVGIGLVKTGAADAFVSAGNTGAVMAFGLLSLGRVPGVERPALTSVFPTVNGRCLILDVGANADCRASQLLQFGVMGSAYMQSALGVTNPRVGLLSIGEEATKGNQLTLEAHQLLKQSGLNFIGNVEGKDIPVGVADVVVTDGFSGNVAIKVAEGVSEAVVGLIRGAVMSRWYFQVAAAVLRPAFRSVAKRLDYAEYGGAPLLGVRGVVIIGHGRSNARAIERALEVAAQAVEGRVVDTIARSMAAVPAPAAIPTLEPS